MPQPALVRRSLCVVAACPTRAAAHVGGGARAWRNGMVTCPTEPLIVPCGTLFSGLINSQTPTLLDRQPLIQWGPVVIGCL